MSMSPKKQAQLSEAILEMMIRHVKKISSMPSTVILLSASYKDGALEIGMSEMGIPGQNVLEMAMVLQQAFSQFMDRNRSAIVQAAINEIQSHIGGEISAHSTVDAIMKKLGIPQVDPNAN